MPAAAQYSVKELAVSPPLDTTGMNRIRVVTRRSSAWTPSLFRRITR